MFSKIRLETLELYKTNTSMNRCKIKDSLFLQIWQNVLRLVRSVTVTETAVFTFHVFEVSCVGRYRSLCAQICEI